jgi:hypothetical protein
MFAIWSVVGAATAGDDAGVRAGIDGPRSSAKLAMTQASKAAAKSNVLLRAFIVASASLQG